MRSLSTAIMLFCSVLASVLTASAQSSHWANPADKYKDAYTAYMDARCPIAPDDMSHFVYFARDRARMRDHAFLAHKRFEGAQIMYAWRQLEPKRGMYDFSMIRDDIDYLAAHQKTLFIQLQDVTFTATNTPLPDYMLTAEFAGGVVPARANGETIGWITKRWNAEVRTRFEALLSALGAAFDGEIEGINLQETAIDIPKGLDPSFTPAAYAHAIQTNMRNLKAAFPLSTTMQYANFMPGEWLPWEDEGYLRGLYTLGETLGVGLGAPDLLFKRRAQLNHPIAMMHEDTFTVPLGIAIQDGNYVGATGADAHFAGRGASEASTQSRVPMLHAFAEDFLKVDYMFWVDQAPYFESQVLSCFNTP